MCCLRHVRRLQVRCRATRNNSFVHLWLQGERPRHDNTTTASPPEQRLQNVLFSLESEFSRTLGDLRSIAKNGISESVPQRNFDRLEHITPISVSTEELEIADLFGEVEAEDDAPPINSSPGSSDPVDLSQALSVEGSGPPEDPGGSDQRAENGKGGARLAKASTKAFGSATL